jgi:gamma-glutamyl-gamma-aminobutyrate hydrolase PuuD
MNTTHLRIAAVSQRVDRLPDRDETRDSLDQALAVWLTKAGLAAFPVPNTLATSLAAGISVESWLDQLAPELVLLSGGNDIGEFAVRDATEMAMLTWAERHKRPVLGICRGMQMLGVAGGGTLAQLDGHVRTHHELGGDWPGLVNSFHKYGFMQCPAGYCVLSHAEDGSVEAMRHESLPWEGWMWHPEREAHRAQDIQRLVQLLNDDN